MLRHMLVVLACCGLAVAVDAGQGPVANPAQPRKLSRDQIPDARELITMADLAIKGLRPPASLFLEVDHHFMRAAAGDLTYVPFTLRFGGTPPERPVAVYVRAALRGDTNPSTERGVLPAIGFTPESLPVFVGERSTARSIPTPGAASAALRLAERPGIPPFPFEDFHFIEWSREPERAARAIRRALVLPPGSYDLYVAVRERGRPGNGGVAPASAIVKKAIEVPGFAGGTLAISDVIVAERIEPLEGPLSRDEQVNRPYAMGSFEVVPASGRTFDQGEDVSFVFFVYNAAELGGKPHLWIEYLFHLEGPDGRERTVRMFDRQVFAEDTLPAGFDLRKERVLIPTLELSLRRFEVGRYRMQVTASDQISGATAVQHFAFTVLPAPGQ
jgi:hypothetical protein